MDAVQELQLREELDAGVDPNRELEIREALLTPSQEEKIKPSDNVLGDIKQKLEVRGEEVLETLEKHAKGEIGTLEANVQVLGKGIAGSILDVAGELSTEGLKQMYKGTSDVVSFLVPDNIEEPIKDKISETVDWLVNSEAGQFISNEISQSIQGGKVAYDALKERYPDEMKTVESIANLGILFAPTKTKVNAEPTILGKASARVKGSALRSQLKNRKKFVSDLITPKRTEKVKIAETARTVEKGFGPTKRSVVELSPREMEIASEVNKIKSVTPKNTIQGNLNTIYKENLNLAKRLEADVSKRRILIPANEPLRRIDDAVTKLVAENPVIVGDAERVATRLAAKAKEIVAKHQNTPAGILKARKELDQWVLRQKGKRAFDPTMENALSESLRAVRQSMNDTVAYFAPSAKAKDLLKRQNLLYEAIDNIGPKAAAESNNAIGRAWQNALKVLPIRGALNQEMAMLLGMGGLGAAATIAPGIRTAMIAGAVGYGGYRLTISPATRKGISQLIRTVDKAILSSKNPSMIKQLRLDRAALVDILKESELVKEEVEE